MDDKTIKLYSNAKNDLIKHVKRKGIEDVSFYCACNSLPLYVAYTYVKEEYPEHNDYCNEQLKTLREFYGY